MAQENLYRPVDIGQHIDQNGVVEERLPNVEHYFFLDKDTRSHFEAEFKQELKNQRDQWLEKNETDYLENFSKNKAFQRDQENSIGLFVREFSDKQVRINVTFIFGHSRWHHYEILLKDFIIDRNEQVDQMFRLKQLEEVYTTTHKGVGYGATLAEVLKGFGIKFYEYPGQSVQLRNIYFPEEDVEVVLQDEQVKYVQKGKPNWLGEVNVDEDLADEEILFSYDHFDVVYIPEFGFAAIDRDENFLFQVFPYDNGPDYPSDDLIRIVEKGKVGYANMEGEIVITPRFECAFPFQNGVARICEEGVLVKDGEYDFWEESRWGAIDKEGNVIIEPFDLGMYTMELLDLKVLVWMNFGGQIKVQAEWVEPDQINFTTSGEGGGVSVVFIDSATDQQLLGYLLLPWQDLYGRRFTEDTPTISAEQLVTVTPGSIIYIVSLASGLSDGQCDIVTELSDMLQDVLGCEEAKPTLNEQYGFTSEQGLQVISMKEHPYYIELSVAIPGSGQVSPEQIRKAYPYKMVLLSQVPDVGSVQTDWIKPGPPEDVGEIETPMDEAAQDEPEALYRTEDIFPDYRPKETPDTMLDYMPSLAGDLARIPEPNPSNLSNLSNPSNLSNLINLYLQFKEDAARSPGEWIDGNMILGAPEREYKPSRDELILSDIGEKIMKVVSDAKPGEVKKILKSISNAPKKVEFTRFTFVHADVMGSGRFFYVDGMEDIEFTLPK